MAQADRIVFEEGAIKLIVQPELTNHCNYRCPFCPHSCYKAENTSGGNLFNRPKGYMPEDVFALVEGNCRRHATCVVLGFFGEQMLHPRFCEYVRRLAAKPRRYSMVINTNLSMATWEHLDALRLFDEVKISLDAYTSEQYERVRRGGRVITLNGRGFHEDRYSGMLDKTRQWLNIDPHPPTLLKFVVSEHTKGTEQQFLDYWLPRLPRQDGVRVKQMITYGGVLRDPVQTPWRCDVLDRRRRRLTVSWDGWMSPCNLDVNMALRYANILERPDFKGAWRCDEYRRIAAAIRRREGHCANCFDANNRTMRTYRGQKR